MTSSSLRRRGATVLSIVSAAVAAAVLPSAPSALAQPAPSAPAASQPAGQFQGLPFGSSAPALAGGLFTPLSQISSLDLKGYLGTWNQVAAIPQPFNLQCARNTTATYTFESADTIGVRNECRDWLGGRQAVIGHARVTDPGTKASLRVWFDNIPFQNPQGAPNYRVTWMSADKQTVVVGSPERLSGFVLSRTPALTPQRWQEVKGVIASRGWNPCVFLTSPTQGGEQRYLPICAL